MADTPTRSTPVDFLVDVREQWQKITWPDTPQLKNFTLVTMAFLGLCAAIIFGMDMIVKVVVDLLHSLFGATATPPAA